MSDRAEIKGPVVFTRHGVAREFFPARGRAQPRAIAEGQEEEAARRTQRREGMVAQQARQLSGRIGLSEAEGRTFQLCPQAAPIGHHQQQAPAAG